MVIYKVLLVRKSNNYAQTSIIYVWQDYVQVASSRVINAEKIIILDIIISAFK